MEHTGKTVIVSGRVQPSTRDKLRRMVAKGRKRARQEEYNLGDLLTNIADYLERDPYGDFFAACRCRQKGLCRNQSE